MSKNELQGSGEHRRCGFANGAGERPYCKQRILSEKGDRFFLWRAHMALIISIENKQQKIQNILLV